MVLKISEIELVKRVGLLKKKIVLTQSFMFSNKAQNTDLNLKEVAGIFSDHETFLQICHMYRYGANCKN